MKTKINPDRMRYQKNTLSFRLCILAVACNVVSLITIYRNVPIDSTQAPIFTLGRMAVSAGLVIGLDVVANIVLLMMFFLTAEKTKLHELFWGKAAFIFAGIQLVRAFFIPLLFFVRNEFSLSNLMLSMLCYLFSATALVLAGIVCVARASTLNAYLKTLDESDSGH